MKNAPDKNGSLSSEKILKSYSDNQMGVGFVHSKNTYLTPEFSHKIKALSNLSSCRVVLAILSDWLMIAACFAVALSFSNFFVWLIAGFLISTRQHALLILMHDGAHYRLFRNKFWNDFVSDFFLAYPVLITTQAYRDNHIAHHLYLNTNKDPDWVRKMGNKDWEFPKTKLGVLWLIIKDVLGGGLMNQIKAIWDLKGSRSSEQKKMTEKSMGRIVYYCLLVTVITIFNFWIPVLCLWFLPVFTFLAAILHIRSIAEHFGLPGENDYDMSRNYKGPWWESFLFVPHHGGYHLDHHLYPSVPYYRLPELHQLLMKQLEYAKVAHQNTSLLGRNRKSVLFDVTDFSNAGAQLL